MAAGLRTARRRKLARTVRYLMGGRRPVPAAAMATTLVSADDLLGLRLAEIAAETKIPPRDSDQAELLARLRLDDGIPADVIVSICGTLMPILAHSDAGKGRR